MQRAEPRKEFSVDSYMTWISLCVHLEGISCAGVTLRDRVGGSGVGMTGKSTSPAVVVPYFVRFIYNNLGLVGESTIIQ